MYRPTLVNFHSAIQSVSRSIGIIGYQSILTGYRVNARDHSLLVETALLYEEAARSPQT